ncbi:tRNA (guanosine(46)-N7)-methyltransferase TrmB [Pontibacillus litoralis]|uniref:tRNA (guanine-N(7)-)-methyltransferase n=1 Tax=Pontibacillus litoralis JSM 072002 TaxID=1385512 RepID=A0A0A5GAW1_9BACI|nr:tRNA (guanosine(46)-N7)-methyltransferase TrmB [Pontibacillus litoralis]KGX89164.1 tRNA (guanine-N(7)-)-methyltransferase [Pontibacillus litoralis JSM 072002]
MRVRHKPWADEYLQENAHIALENSYSYRGKWKEVYSNQHPIHVEIGSGKGQFIAGMSTQHPSVNFIGIEREKSIIVDAVKKVKEAEVPNARLLLVDAKDLRDLFADNEVEQIYLNFSDPWPKNRHEKRRLTYPAMLEQYKAVLKPNGRLVMKTDNRGLFEYSLVSFSQFGCTLEDVSVHLHNDDDPLNVMTEYEEKFSSRGYPIYRCVVQFPF